MLVGAALASPLGPSRCGGVFVIFDFFRVGLLYRDGFDQMSAMIAGIAHHRAPIVDLVQDIDE
jgi:hypothetical protein